jgi:translation initiation factor 2 alpha subunit (eIF-2alpha)
MEEENKKFESLSEGDIILCTVDKIIGTIVFVKIPLLNKEIEGNIIFSEVSPGRIRNIRDYVVPKKKIVCKILRIKENRIDLSLRRVSLKEKKEVIEKFKQENSYKNILKSILKQEAENLIIEITKKQNLYDFIEEIKKNPIKMEKLIGKENTEKILNIILEQKRKKRIIKKRFSLISYKPNGITLIKNLLNSIKNAKIKYISSGKYSIEIESEDLKKADKELKEILINLEKKSKKQEIQFSTL